MQLVMYLTLVCACKVSAQTKLLPTDDIDVRISAITDQFLGWDLVLHTDEQLMDFVAAVLDNTVEDTPLTILKYSTYTPAFYRPNVYRCVNFVLQSGLSAFLDYTKVESNVQEDDIIIITTGALNASADYKHLYATGLDMANMVFFLNTTFALAVYFYSAPTFATVVQTVAINEDGIPQLNAYRNAFEDFRGFPMLVGYTECPPFVYMRDGALRGVEHEIWLLVAQRLNITPVMVDYTHRTNPRMTLIQDVNKSVVNMAIGCLANNIKRHEMVAFGNAIHYESNVALYASAGRYEDDPLHTVISPISVGVWLCCIFTLVILALCIKLLVRFSRETVQVNAILVPFKILIEQSTTMPRNSNVLRIGLVAWILVGLSLSSSYKTKLTAAVMMPHTREPNSLEALYNEGLHFISPATDSTYLIEVLKYSNNIVENMIGEELEDSKIACEAVERVVNDMAVIIEEVTSLRFNIWNYCQKNLTRRQIASLRRVERPVTAYSHMWAMPKSAPYKHRVSFTLEVLKSYGLVQHSYRGFQISRSIPIANTVNVRDDGPLEVRDVLAAFIILAAGSVAALVAFLSERFIHATRTHIHEYDTFEYQN